MLLNQHNKVCSDVNATDEDFAGEEGEQIVDEIEIEEQKPNINISEILQNKAFRWDWGHEICRF